MYTELKTLASLQISNETDIQLPSYKYQDRSKMATYGMIAVYGGKLQKYFEVGSNFHNWRYSANYTGELSMGHVIFALDSQVFNSVYGNLKDQMKFDL